MARKRAPTGPEPRARDSLAPRMGEGQSTLEMFPTVASRGKMARCTMKPSSTWPALTCPVKIATKVSAVKMASEKR